MNRLPIIGLYAAMSSTLPLAVWGLLPDLSEKGGRDHLLEPFVLSGPLRASVGLTAAVILAGAVALLWSPSIARMRGEDDVLVVAPLLAAVGYSALTYRVATFAVHGANILGGLLLLLGAPGVPALLLCSLTEVRKERRRRATGRGTGTNAG